MDGYKKSKPLYFFVLRTGVRPVLNLRDGKNDKLLRQLIADNSTRIFRTDLKSCDVKSEQPVAAISGSSLPFGCWDNPKIATSVTRDLHILAINEDVPWSTYKWLDIHRGGMDMPHGGLDKATGFCYEPIAYTDRVFDARVPQPGKEIAIVSEKWGENGTDILYISLGGNKANQDINQNKPKEEINKNLEIKAIESQIEAQMIQAEPQTITESTKPETTRTVNNSHSMREERAQRPKAASEERVQPSTAQTTKAPVKLRAHRPQLELEPEEGMDEAEPDLDPQYGKPVPYKFGQRLSLKLPWKREKHRDTSSGPPSCSSSVSSAEGSGETWTKTGSLPAMFRKRGKRPAETVASHPVDQPGPTATNGSVPEKNNKKLNRMRRFRNSLSDLFKSKNNH